MLGAVSVIPSPTANSTAEEGVPLKLLLPVAVTVPLLQITLTLITLSEEEIVNDYYEATWEDVEPPMSSKT